MGALLLAGCTRDLTDQRISEAETATAEKILNESNDALQGSIIVRFAPSLPTGRTTAKPWRARKISAV